MEVSEVGFSELSCIEYRMFLYGPSKSPSLRYEPRILVMEFKGRYKDGGEGREDSQFMTAMTCAALSVWYIKGMLPPFKYNAISKSVLRKNYPFDVFVVEANSPEHEKRSEYFQRVKFPPPEHKGILRIKL